MKNPSDRTQKNKVPEVTPQTIIARTKALFTPEVLEVSPFAKDLYKIVRNKVKKLDDIIRIEERVKDVKGDITKVITEEQVDKLKNKESYMQSVLQQLDAFEIYKNSEFAAKSQPVAQVAETIPHQQVPLKQEEEKEVKPSSSTQTQTQGGVENKVVECSILQAPPTVVPKETQASAPKVEEAPAPVKLLVKDHTTNIEEAFRVISPILVLLPHLMSIMGPNQNLIIGSKMTALEAQLLHQLYLNLTMPSSFQESIEERIKKTVIELTKIASGNNESQKVAFNPQFTYGDLKKILNERLLNNKDLLSLNMSQINFPIMPSAGLTAPTAQPFGPTALGLLPSGFNIPPQVPQQQPPVVVSQQTPQQPEPQVTTTTTQAKHEVVVAPAQREWHDDEEEEEEEHELGVQQHHSADHHHHHHHHEEEKEEPAEEDQFPDHAGSGEQEEVPEEGEEEDTTQVEKQEEEIQPSPPTYQPREKRPYEKRPYDPNYRGRGGNYRGAAGGNYRGGNYRGGEDNGYRGGRGGEYRGNSRGNWEPRRGRGGFHQNRVEGGERPDHQVEGGEASQEPNNTLGLMKGSERGAVGSRGSYRGSRGGNYYNRERQEGEIHEKTGEEGGENQTNVEGKEEHRGGYRGRGGRGGYRGHHDRYQNQGGNTSEGGSNPFYRNNNGATEGGETTEGGERVLKKFFSEGGPRPYKQKYKNYDNNYEGGQHQNQKYHGGYKKPDDIDGFEVVKKRGENQGPTPFGEGRGPRVARGAQDVYRGQSRGGYRGGERRPYQDLRATASEGGASEAAHQNKSE